MKTINYIFVSIIIALYASLHFLGPDKLHMDSVITSVEFHKPWVYRALVPLLARWLDLIMPLDWAIVLLITLSGVGFYHALRKLASVFYVLNIRTELYLLASVPAGLFLFHSYFTIYDLATAFLFTLSLYYMITERHNEYLILFPFICLNRETAILLTVFCCVFFYHKKHNEFDFIGVQVFVWLVSQIKLRSFFYDNAGDSLWIEPLQNLQKFADNPALTALHFAATLLILVYALKGWNQKPLFLRLAFLTFAPLLFTAYIVMGQSFEIRIFWELYPVLVLLVVQYQNNEISLSQSPR